MPYSKSIGAVVSIIIVSVLIYSNVARSNIAFAQKPTQISTSTINPINEVESGSIIYTLNDRSSFTQMALDTKVQMDITGTINRTKLSQTFVNPSNEWVEGVYVFPLPTDSAVDHLTMHIGSRSIEGQIKERKEAKRIYTKAKESVTLNLSGKLIIH